MTGLAHEYYIAPSYEQKNASNDDDDNNDDYHVYEIGNIMYSSVSQPLWDRGPVNSFFTRRGPGPNRFTGKYLSNFFKFIH